jgi:hypothetical protein
MTRSPPAPPSAADGPTRFLVELENTWTLLRVYGTEHPAFRRGAEAAATAVERPGRVSINPRGFTVGSSPVANANLLPFSRRLRSMGLVGLTMEPGLTPAEVVSLVLVLNEADRTKTNADAVVEKIAAATGGRVRGVPLRLGGLKLVEGTADAADGKDMTGVWREMFSDAFGGPLDPSSTTGLAEAFETALRGDAGGQWDAMIGVWMRQLAAIDRNTPGAGSAADSTGSPADPSPASQQGSASTATPAPANAAAAADDATPLDAVATFMGALSPLLCQRLLKETITEQVLSDRVVLGLADRLPAGVVLGALAAVDKTNGEPSTAALALLRKISANVPGATVQASPATRAELAEVASALESLLGTQNEQSFVPEEYLQRRQELSRSPLSGTMGPGMTYPSEKETARHAVDLAFQILSAAGAATSEVAAALAYIRNRVGDWIRAGEFALAREAMSHAAGLSGHEDPSVAKSAQAIVAASVNSGDLVDGARQRKDVSRAAEELAGLLRQQTDGTTLATLLASIKPREDAAAGNEVLLQAVRRVLPTLAEDAMAALFRAINSTPPPALLAVLTGMKAADALKAIGAMVPHAGGATRCALVHVIFRRDFRWPLPLIERLLQDDEPEIRRLAVMKLVSDADLATAAGFLSAASRKGRFETDVALGLAELLRRHRHHPDVKPAWRQWAWSKRWWMALLFVNIGTPRRAA